jgi:phasin family protein
MADLRRNQQESASKTAEAARSVGREAASETEDAAQAGVQGLRRVADEFGRVFGFAGQSEDLARQATQNLGAITEAGSVLMRGFQDVSREWVALAQERLQSNAEGLAKLAQCRSLPDLAAVQSELVRENLQQMIENSRRVAEHSIQVANEAARTIAAETEKAARRLPRAA